MVRNQYTVRSSIVAAVAAILVLTGAGAASAIPPLEFTDVGVPVITGAVVVGSTLSIDLDEPTPTPDFVDVEWTADDVVVRTVHASTTDESADLTYTIAPADLGKHMQVHLTLSKDGYENAETDSVATDAVASGTQSFTPVVSGSAAAGYTLSVTGLPVDATFTYVWKRGGTASAIGTGSTYKLTSSDVGHTVTVAVTSTKPGYNTVSKTSAPTAKVLKAFAWHTPKISGTAKVGHKLTASTSAWSPTPSFKYQWYRNGVAIGGATGSTRTLTSYDEGALITVKLTGSKSGYLTTSKTSAATAVIATGTISVASPSISGTRQAGHTLTAVAHTPTPSSAVKTYSWYRSGVATGKTGSTYALKNIDAGKTITVHVTYKATGYATKTVNSPKTAAIAKRSAVAKSGKEYRLSSDGSSFSYLAPGTYVTTSTSDSCFALIDEDHDPDNNNNSAATGGKGRWVFKLSKTDGAFFSSGCGSWITYDASGPAHTTISSSGGVFQMGVDLVPGIYEQSSSLEGCEVGVLDGPLSSNFNWLYRESADASSTIEVDDTPGWWVYTWGCGTWTRVADLP